MLGGAVAAAALHAAPASAAERLIAQRASARVIVDNDFAGDPDGLVALAHQLLSPRTRVPLVTCSALDPKIPGGAPAGRTAAAGRDLAVELARRAGLRDGPRVLAGSETFDPGPTAASRAIAAEAMRDDPLPLFLACGGPLTNVAAALRSEPAIARRMTVVWIGGGGPDGGPEYNLATDAPAAAHVVEGSAVPLWQVPRAAYRRWLYSVAEMTADLRPISPLSRWLYERYLAIPSWVDLGGAVVLGDSPLVQITALSPDAGRFRDVPARRIGPGGRDGGEAPGRMVRLYEELDPRLAFADLLALLRLHARAGGRA